MQDKQGRPIPPMFGTDNPPPGSPVPTATFDTGMPPTHPLPGVNAPPIPPPGTAVDPNAPTAEVPSFWSERIVSYAHLIADDPALRELAAELLKRIETKLRGGK